MLRWVARERSYDPSIPETISHAKDLAHAHLAIFEGLSDIAVHGGDTALRLVPDTNALLRNPAPEDLGAAVNATSYTVHLVPTVLAELDELKDRGRTQDVLDKAEKAVRRLKGLRDRGHLSAGVRVAGNIYLRAEHREVDPPSMLSWLNPTVPDDRIIAAALYIQSCHPAGTVVLITADINLQNKADVVGLPFAEPRPC